MINSLVLALLGGLSFLFLTACTPFTADFGSSSPAATEPEYKGTPTDYSGTNPIYIKVLAKYKYRTTAFDISSPAAMGLRSTTAERGIPHCEFHVYDSAGNRIQQGETDEDGYAAFAIPRTQGTYSLKVYSRALNDYIKVSVLADIYSNEPYAITKNFTLNTGNINSGTTVGSPYTGFTTFYAEADEAVSSNIEGGAFNILYDVYLANEYIRNQTGRTTLVSNWWVANKVTAYWKAGFNPYTYISSGSTSGVSFYSQGTNNLFILGGISGNVRTADTDHFDDSIILHEYAHFLEDNYGNSQSPGGSHDGNFIIDARLAWSEGWANYFQSAVLSDTDDVPNTDRPKYYIDTYGYKTSDGDTSGGIGVVFNLAQAAASATKDNISLSTPASEGNFREVSISRTLYKSSRNSAQVYTGTKYGGGISFTEIWKTFSGELSSMTQSLSNTSAFPLPSIGAFNYFLNLNTAVSDKTKWNAVLTEEKQPVDASEFGQVVTSKVASCTRSITGTADSFMAGDSLPRSNHLKNNDFLVFYYNGNGSTINLNATQTVAPTVSSYQMDLDLYVYYLSYVYFEEAYIDAGYKSQYLAKYKRTPASTSMNESISMSGLPSGYYMINVKLNSLDKITNEVNGTVTYDLKIGSNFLCP
jgi:hypothetical protein